MKHSTNEEKHLCTVSLTLRRKEQRDAFDVAGTHSQILQGLGMSGRNELYILFEQADVFSALLGNLKWNESS